MAAAHAVPADKVEYAKAVELVKSRVVRWPNAYASGMVVQEYKKAMAAKGKIAYLNDVPKSQTGLARWYEEKWVDIKTGKPCGAVHTSSHYPTCRPSKKVTAKSPVIADALSDNDKKKMIRQKQAAKSTTVHYKETARPNKKP